MGRGGGGSHGWGGIVAGPCQSIGSRGGGQKFFMEKGRGDCPGESRELFRRDPYKGKKGESRRRRRVGGGRL